MGNGIARIVMLAAVALAAAPVTAPAAEPPRDFYGTFTLNDDLAGAERAATLDKQAALGIGMTREHIHWDRIERMPGVYDWAATDKLVLDAAHRKLTILPVLLTTPTFYSSRPIGGKAGNWPPKDPSKMGNWAAAMVRRYGPAGSFWYPNGTRRTPFRPIRAWQVWNEPDIGGWWPAGPNPAAYSALVKAVSPAIRIADPQAEVVLAGISNHGVNGTYLSDLYRNGLRPYFDTLAFHPYARNVSGSMSLLRKARGIADAWGDQAKPIRVTEYGWATAGRSGGGDFTVDEPCQAALMYAETRRLGALRDQLKLKGIVQFLWNDRPPLNDIWPYYAGLIRLDGTQKPSYGTLKAAIAAQVTPTGYRLADVCPPDRQATY